MRKRNIRKGEASQSQLLSSGWLPNLLIWSGVLLMLTGGILAYPTIQGYVGSPDAQSLEFGVTITAPPAVAAVHPALQVQPTQTVSSKPAPQSEDEIAAPAAPPPAILPETELLAEKATATAPPSAIPPETEPADAQAVRAVLPLEVPTEVLPTREAASEPTTTLIPTPAPDPASQIPDRVVIPAIGLDAPVVRVGWETKEVNGQLVSSWLVPDRFAAGWHATSALPGFSGNTVLNGHHNIHGEVFRYLEDVQPGDDVIVYAGETRHRYTITERHILEEKNQPQEVRLKNAQFIMPSEDERLTMVTCWPYTDNTHRLIIVAVPLQSADTPTTIAE